MTPLLTTVDFSGMLIAEVVKIDDVTRELAVYIYKLMSFIPKDSATEYNPTEPTVQKDILISASVPNPKISMCNYIWVKPGFHKNRLPSVGSKVSVYFIDSDPQKGVWYPFGLDNDQHEYYEPERYLEVFKVDTLGELSPNTDSTDMVSLPHKLMEEDTLVVKTTSGVKSSVNIDRPNKKVILSLSLDNTVLSNTPPAHPIENLIWVSEDPKETKVYINKGWHIITPRIVDHAFDSDKLGGKFSHSYADVIHSHDYVDINKPNLKGTLNCNNHEITNVPTLNPLSDNRSVVNKKYVDSNFPMLVDSLIPEKYLPNVNTEDAFCDLGFELSELKTDYIAEVTVPQGIAKYEIFKIDSTGSTIGEGTPAELIDGLYYYTEGPLKGDVVDLASDTDPNIQDKVLATTVTNKRSTVMTVNESGDITATADPVEITAQSIVSFNGPITSNLKHILLDNFQGKSATSPNSIAKNKYRLYSYEPIGSRGFYDLSLVKSAYDLNPKGSFIRASQANTNAYIDIYSEERFTFISPKQGATGRYAIVSDGVTPKTAAVADMTVFYVKQTDATYLEIPDSSSRFRSLIGVHKIRCDVIKPEKDSTDSVTVSETDITHQGVSSDSTGASCTDNILGELRILRYQDKFGPFDFIDDSKNDYTGKTDAEKIGWKNNSFVPKLDGDNLTIGYIMLKHVPYTDPKHSINSTTKVLTLYNRPFIEIDPSSVNSGTSVMEYVYDKLDIPGTSYTEVLSKPDSDGKTTVIGYDIEILVSANIKAKSLGGALTDIKMLYVKYASNIFGIVGYSLMSDLMELYREEQHTPEETPTSMPYIMYKSEYVYCDTSAQGVVAPLFDVTKRYAQTSEDKFKVQIIKDTNITKHPMENAINYILAKLTKN